MKNTYSYVDALNEVLSYTVEMTEAGYMSEQCHDKLVALRDQVAKRNASKSDKPTKAQVANEGVKAQILDALTEPKRCGDIAKELDLSGQKVSALLRQLVEAGKVTKFEGDKRVTLFQRVA